MAQALKVAAAAFASVSTTLNLKTLQSGPTWMDKAADVQCLAYTNAPNVIFPGLSQPPDGLRVEVKLSEEAKANLVAKDADGKDVVKFVPWVTLQYHTTTSHPSDQPLVFLHETDRIDGPDGVWKIRVEIPVGVDPQEVVVYPVIRFYDTERDGDWQLNYSCNHKYYVTDMDWAANTQCSLTEDELEDPTVPHCGGAGKTTPLFREPECLIVGPSALFKDPQWDYRRFSGTFALSSYDKDQVEAFKNRECPVSDKQNIETQCPLPSCKNGGACVTQGSSPSVCNCSFGKGGFTGPLCETAKPEGNGDGEGETETGGGKKPASASGLGVIAAAGIAFVAAISMF